MLFQIEYRALGFIALATKLKAMRGADGTEKLTMRGVNAAHAGFSFDSFRRCQETGQPATYSEERLQVVDGSMKHLQLIKTGLTPLYIKGHVSATETLIRPHVHLLNKC